jgi:hypothetical protein
MRGCQASIRFNDYRAEVVPLDNAGLVQDSPLSPILLALFDCDLVDQTVHFHGGAYAFVDDYFCWSAAENLVKTESEDAARAAA